jgi:hypothetical protein
MTLSQQHTGMWEVCDILHWLNRKHPTLPCNDLELSVWVHPTASRLPSNEAPLLTYSTPILHLHCCNPSSAPSLKYLPHNHSLFCPIHPMMGSSYPVAVMANGSVQGSAEGGSARQQLCTARGGIVQTSFTVTDLKTKIAASQLCTC